MVFLAVVMGGHIWYANIVNPVTKFPPTIVGILGVVFLMAPYLPAEERRDGIAETARFIVAGAGGGLAAKITFENNYSILITLILIFGVFVTILFFEMVLRLMFHHVPGEE